MKTLANCTPVEFLRQTNKIRHAVSDLFGAAGIQEIRKRLPAFSGSETVEERKAMLDKQGRENFSDILDALMDVNAEATVELLGLMCFQTPEEMAEKPGIDYLVPVMELLKSEPVRDFLSMFMGLAQSGTGK